jgi:hypothetical protein
MNRLAQCHCGSLRANISGDPLMVNLCHCRDCPRRTGASAGSGAIFQKAQVTIEGDRRVFERDGQEGRKVRFHFCPSCGTSLYWEGDFRPGWCVVAVGAFADPTFPPPSMSLFEESKHTWVQLPDGMKHAQRGSSRQPQSSMPSRATISCGWLGAVWLASVGRAMARLCASSHLSGVKVYTCWPPARLSKVPEFRAKVVSSKFLKYEM